MKLKYVCVDMINSDLHFHHIHGKNVRICNGGRIAVRPYGFAEFTDAVVLANRPLKSNEIFAIRVEKVIDKWSGSLEIGAYHCVGNSSSVRN